MINLSLIKEEMSIRGFCDLGFEISQADWICNDLLDRKNKEIKQYGEEYLLDRGYFDLMRNAITFEKPYIDLITSPWLNEVVNFVLNDKAVIHDSFATFNTIKDEALKNQRTRYLYHRDSSCFRGIRTSISFLIPLIETTKTNGATIVVPGTHLFDQIPSEDFLEKHKVSLIGPAGRVYLIDSSLIHTTGVNQTMKPRPMLNIRYQLAFMKTPMNLCSIYAKDLEGASDLIKQRFGWECRSETNLENSFVDPIWKSGQYKMDNTYVF